MMKTEFCQGFSLKKGFSAFAENNYSNEKRQVCLF